MEEELLLLRLVKNNGRIENLSKQGFEYSQIAKMISKFIENDYIAITPNSIELTSKGEEKLILLNTKLKRNKIDKFISPQKEYLLSEKKSIYDIYLPDKI